MTQSKWLRCLAAGSERVATPDPGVTLVHDVVGDQALLSLHGMPPRDPLPYSGLVWEWREDPAHAGDGEHLYRVLERPVFDELPPRDAQGWRPGVKQISFLVRPEGVAPDEFRELYHHHTAKLRDDQPGIAKYVQNVVEQALPGAPALDGFSELWFASVEDWRERYWSGPDVPAREHAETSRFLDFRRTWSLIVRERVLPEAPA